MKRFANSFSVCALMAAVFFTINCFAEGTNGVSGENQEKTIVPEDGPLKELATIVLNTGKETKLSNWEFHNLISSTNDPFTVFERDSHSASGHEEIFVGQQQGKTVVIISCSDRDVGNLFTESFLTFPAGILEKTVHFVNGAPFDLHTDKANIAFEQSPTGMVTKVIHVYKGVPSDVLLKNEQDAFQRHVNFWVKELNISDAKPEEPNK